MFYRLKIYIIAFLGAFIGIFMPAVVYAGSVFGNVFSILAAVVSVALIVATGGTAIPTLSIAIAPGTGAMTIGGLVAGGVFGTAYTAFQAVSIGLSVISAASSAANLSNGCPVTSAFGQCSGSSAQQQSSSQSPSSTPNSLSSFSCSDGSAGGFLYDTPGEYTYTVPPNLIELNVEAWGAGGLGSNTQSSGGNGGYTTGKLSVTPGEELSVIVGTGGGGGVSSALENSFGWGGEVSPTDARMQYVPTRGKMPIYPGGLSGVFRGAIDFDELSNNVPLIIAGGGGQANRGYGGHGGGLEGMDGGWVMAVTGSGKKAELVHGSGGKGGTQTEGGAGCPPGSFLQGGSTCAVVSVYIGGSGGGGYYGGGGANGIYDTSGPGGGGGSSLVPPDGKTIMGGGSSGAYAPGRESDGPWVTDPNYNGVLQIKAKDGKLVIHTCVAPEANFCDDGIDNDQDGFTDCFDNQCGGDASCAGFQNVLPPENTGNFFPEAGTAPLGSLDAPVCFDGVDNDQDGDVDCNDSDCSTEPICSQPNFSLFSSNAIFLTFLGSEERSESTFTNISVLAENGFNEDISCGVASVEIVELTENPEGVPEGIIAGFTDPILSADEYSTGTLFGVSLPGDVPAGSYNIIIACNGGGLIRTVSVGLNVETIAPMFYEF